MLMNLFPIGSKLVKSLQEETGLFNQNLPAGS